jgi:pimeloyl-ACP methyl ester carboxylesterase
MSEQIVEVPGGVTLCCERLGRAGDPPIVLIMGLGQQLLAWPDEFCAALVERGYEVVRFDNRDIGRSWHASTPPPSLRRLFTRRFVREQYDLSDMARDTAGLIDALGIRPAHVVGISLGGMIAQTLAALYPAHVRSLVSIMSTTGARTVGWAAPRTLSLLLQKPARTREEAGERAVRMWRQIGSVGFEFDEPSTRERAMAAFDRDPRAAAGAARQIAAILKSGNRTRLLRQIAAPTLVIHGDRDLMVHPSGGRATAKAIPGARSETVAGLGHDLPAGAYGQLIALIAEHAAQADGARDTVEAGR